MAAAPVRVSSIFVLLFSAGLDLVLTESLSESIYVEGRGGSGGNDALGPGASMSSRGVPVRLPLCADW